MPNEEIAMGAYRGVFLDFYGTLVHEDDAVIKTICTEIRDSSSSDISQSDVAHYWWKVYVPLCTASHGNGFQLQRDLGLQSLRQTIDHFHAVVDPIELIERQRTHWSYPPIFDDTHEFLEGVGELGL